MAIDTPQKRFSFLLWPKPSVPHTPDASVTLEDKLFNLGIPLTVTPEGFEPLDGNWAYDFPESNAVHRSLNFLKAERAFNKYTTIVAADGTADYTTVQDAIAAGKKAIWIKAGNYAIDSNIAIEGVSMEGENAKTTVLTFTNSKLTMAGATIETAGTIALNTNQSLVKGTGTSFTNVSGTRIFLHVSGMSFEVDRITSNTRLSLKVPYFGPTLSGQTFQLFSTDSALTKISNLELVQANPDATAREFLTIFGFGIHIERCYVHGDSYTSNLIQTPSTTQPAIASFFKDNMLAGGANGFYGSFKSCHFSGNHMVCFSTAAVNFNFNSPGNVLTNNMHGGSARGSYVAASSDRTLITKSNFRLTGILGCDFISGTYCTVAESIFDRCINPIQLGGVHSKSIGNTIGNSSGKGITVVADFCIVSATSNETQAIAGASAVLVSSTGDYCIISKCIAYDPADRAIEFEGNFNAITSNLAYSTTGVAFASTAGLNTAIAACLSDTPSTDGFRPGAAANGQIVFGCLVSAPGDDGVHISGDQSLFVACTIEGATDNGIECSSEFFVVFGCGSHGNGDTGIILLAGFGDNGCAVGNTSKNNLTANLTNAGAGNTVAQNEI